jgi:D-alanyl-D-alanine carboxypeptidase
VLLSVFWLGLAPTGSAHAESKPIKQAAMVIDANTGKVLHAQFADQPRYPA